MRPLGRRRQQRLDDQRLQRPLRARAAHSAAAAEHRSRPGRAALPDRDRRFGRALRAVSRDAGRRGRERRRPDHRHTGAGAGRRRRRRRHARRLGEPQRHLRRGREPRSAGRRPRSARRRRLRSGADAVAAGRRHLRRRLERPDRQRRRRPHLRRSRREGARERPARRGRRRRDHGARRVAVPRAVQLRSCKPGAPTGGGGSCGLGAELVLVLGTIELARRRVGRRQS